ncbi:hypothetical protein B0H15DRAFT_890880 [Mycena belliarum]|uniref:SH3 domain-containing protein n=1 Tax=Mycena belliarum TaxID=1033014 RepID=A0AAD6TUS7_9AGAR|nr:hypothetical protein B0H15DRAFT_890880 [Mycena belliae]
MHHNPSRMVRERRQTIPTSASASPATAGVETGLPTVVNLKVPTSTTVLAVIVAILAVVVLLCVGICMFRRWRRGIQKNDTLPHIIDFTHEKPRRYAVESKLDLHASAYGLEKPSPVFLPGASPADMNPGWVPQINPNRGADLKSQSSKSTTSSKKSKSKKSLRSSRGWDRTFSKIAPSERSPPPSYMVGEQQARTPSFASDVPLPPSPPHQSTLPPTPPTPPAKKKNPFSRDLPPAKPAPMELPPQMPLPSPARTASFAAHQSATFAHMEGDDEQAVPRLMTVTNSFTPTLDDELAIQIGETIRILEEYQDGWALVQRIGRIDAPKGVVPRTCITERDMVIPTFSSGRRL